MYGGGSRRNQIKTVQKGVEIIVATPGRLNDLINAEILSIHHVSFLVLDEADRMLDLGFEPEIRKVLNIKRPLQIIIDASTACISNTSNWLPYYTISMNSRCCLTFVQIAIQL